jgi:hypothetical protein
MLEPRAARAVTLVADANDDTRHSAIAVREGDM